MINLRGERIDCGSDRLGRAAAAAAGLVHVDAPFESRGAPHKDRILRLAEIFRSVPEPILIHCKSGADRTGLAAGIWLLLQGRPVEQAMAQLTLRHGHIRQGRPASSTPSSPAMPRTRGRRRSPSSTGLREDYDEAALRRDFTSQPWADRLLDGILGGNEPGYSRPSFSPDPVQRPDQQVA